MRQPRSSTSYWRRSPTGASFDDIERTVREIVRRIGHKAITSFVVLQGDGNLGESVETEDGKVLHRSEAPARASIRSIFGVHPFKQFTYSAVDCKGVPLVKEDASKVAAFETAKKNPGNRSMATVASVYTVDPHIRTAEQVTEALFREEITEDRAKNRRPKPQNKTTTAHFPSVEEDGTGGTLAISGIHVAMAWLISQVTMRRRLGQVLIVLMDGQQSLWDTIKLHISFSARTVPIRDILHALSYVWQAAGLFEKTDAGRKAFTRPRLLRILRGEVHGVIHGLWRLGTMRKLSGKARKDLNRICICLEKNADHRIQREVTRNHRHRSSRRVVEPFMLAKPYVGNGQRVGTLLLPEPTRFRSDPILHADNLLGIGTNNIIWNNYQVPQRSILSQQEFRHRQFLPKHAHFLSMPLIRKGPSCNGVYRRCESRENLETQYNPQVA